MNSNNKMNALELRASVSLALIFFLRMFGLFLILPIFVLYANDLEGATPGLVGMGLGIYGLSQALLQIPFGMLSDRFGRKPIIAIGLMIFMLGSIIAGLADHIYLIILGRALQGAGAVASAIMALTADLTRTEHRTKAMAIIGMSVGLAFSFSFVLGPVFAHLFQFSGVFFLTASLAAIAIFILFYSVPNPEISKFHNDTGMRFESLKQVLTDRVLLSFDLGIFFLHMLLMANFIAIPFALYESLGLATEQHWKMYLPVIILSMLTIVPFIIMADKKQLSGLFFLSAIILLSSSQILLFFFHQSIWSVFTGLCLFFIAFNYLEASLPSLISKSVEGGYKGTALGVYSSSQFIGTFLGGLLGGILFGHYGYQGVFLFGTIIATLWFIIASTCRRESRNKTVPQTNEN